MRNASSYINTGFLFSKAILKFLRLKWFLRFNYHSSVDFEEDIEKDYSYYSKYYNRAQQYMHANHFFGELLCMSRGVALKKDEIKRFIWLSSCAPVFDDFFENNNDNHALRELMGNPLIEKAESNSEKLAAHFFKLILDDVENPEKVIQTAEQLFDAQILSKSQSDPNVDIDDLLRISKDKGGYSGLLYSLLLNGNQASLFYDLAFELGAYGQLMDDVFDLYDDAKSGIRTFANQSSKIQDIKLIVEDHEMKIFDLLNSMHLVNNQKKNFLKVLRVFGSIINLAIDQYEKNEKIDGVSPSDCLNLNREKWIVDMEKASNIWKLFKLSSTR